MRRNVYYYTQLDKSFPDAATLLGDDPGLWLPAPAEPVEAGWRVALDATGALPRTRALRLAVVQPEPLRRSYDRVWRRMRWRDARGDRLFPVMEADVELEALVDGRSRLSLVGSYEPPGALVGSLTDSAFGHRVAESCVRRFVLDIADRLEASREAMVGHR
jgi:hypothetical protein